MADASAHSGRPRSFDLTASSTRTLLVAVALVCGGLWAIVLAAMQT